MKFLIAEDDDDLREVISFLISSNYDIQVFQAINGENAIDILQRDGPFDLVICDYNMPKKNGGDVYLALRQINPQTPFILVSTDIDKFKKQVGHFGFCDWVDKPFDESEITRKIEAIFNHVKLPLIKESYLPISIEMLEKIELAGVSIYLKLNQNQYIKVLKENAIFDKSEYIRFKNKKLTHLYIEILDLKSFITVFRKNIFSKLDWDNVEMSDALIYLEMDWNLILQGASTFGWPSSLTTLAKENIARTISLIGKKPELKKILDGLKISTSKSHIYAHCYTLVFLTTAILNELSWGSAATIQKMTFACLLHDMDLNELMFANKLVLIDNKKLQNEIHQQTNYLIYNHVNTAAQFVNGWSGCPADVDKLIIQHHEKFDGTGFPNKLNFLNIFPLAGVFIIAEDLLYQKMNHPEVNLTEFLKTNAAYYNRGDFKKVYEAALKAVENT
jgi:response regulator RpfG family c-di-GMP phosphodiesterase